MTIDDISPSAIQRIASYSPYLDALVGIASEMGLRERSNLVLLEKSLHTEWGLGQQCILGWTPHEDGILILVIPHYAVAEYAAGRGGQASSGWQLSEEFIKSLLSHRRLFSEKQLRKIARLLAIEPRYLPLRQAVGRTATELEIIEQMVKRYGISFVPSRAVALFDIVGFSLLSPFEQMTQLNSLSYSLNSAQSKLMDNQIGVSFGRSTTGDGFYIWNRDESDAANANLYRFMHLVLADNAIAKQRATANSVPRLRAAFHVGSCYEFHQAEGLNPTIHDYIVGDVTIELARMIDKALPGQIFVGDFHVGADRNNRPSGVELDAIGFVDHAQDNLAQLEGLELSGERISSIKCYLTGEKNEQGFNIRRLIIADKHGLSRSVYNAKVNIYRERAEPILLGIEDRKLRKLFENQASFELVSHSLQQHPTSRP
ncbi:MAG: hypothetical protein AAGC71_04635 [Pseudomonadota bacterium]